MSEGSIKYTCTKCGHPKSMADMATNRQAARGFGPWCKQCKATSARNWAHANPDKITEQNDMRRLARYSLTQDEYDTMLDEQGGRCAICHDPEPHGVGTWHIDHDHECCSGSFSCGACVRGLLCMKCNRRVGILENASSWAIKARAYLTKQQN